MKKPIVIMSLIIVIILVVAGGGVGTYLYLKKHHGKGGASSPPKLSASQAAALQFTLPEMTTNLKSSGLIQFTMTLQSNNKSTKVEVTKMQNQIEDKVNQVMRQFSATDLRSVSGFNTLKKTLSTDVNNMLQKGKVTNVYFSQVVVQ